MEVNVPEGQSLLSVEQKSADQAFWCEPVDLADGEENDSDGKSFDGCNQCGCGCTCSCN